MPLRPRIQVDTKVLLPTAAVLVALVAATLWMINSQIAAQIRDFAAESLHTSREVVQEFRKLRTQGGVDPRLSLANDPRFKAIMRGSPDRATMRRLLLDTLDERSVDFLVVGDEQGLLIAAESRDPNLRLVDDGGGSLIDFSPALNGEPLTRVLCRDDRLLDVAFVPVEIDGEIIGVVIAGSVMGDEAALDLRHLTGCEVALCAGDKVVGLTLPRADDRRVLNALLQGADSPLRGSDDRVEDVLLNGEHYIVLAGRLEDKSTERGPRPAYLLLGRYERQLQRLGETRRLLLRLGVFGVVASMLATWLIVRAATRPLGVLRASAEAVGRGDFTQRVEVQANDEFGDLAAAFNDMTANVRLSRERLENTVATLQDTRERLVQSEKLSAIGEFIAGVAHELNNPLTVMVGFADLLREADLKDEEKQNVQLIAESAERCRKVVQNLLSFARQRAPERVPVNLNELIETTVRFLAYELRTGGIAVARHYDPKLPLVLADPGQMQQVFLNIINNARQAMESLQAAGKLRLETGLVNGRVRVTIADSGPGIPPAIINRIFDPFFTTKADGKGTGLGLSVSYGIVHEHGGELHVESPPGSGAIFVIDLPPAAADAGTAASVPVAAASAWRAPQPCRAAIVDDEDAILDLVHDVLADSGIVADRFRDGHEAYVGIGKQAYELIICDWRMPVMGGRQLLELLRAGHPQLLRRLIFMTGDVLNTEVLATVQRAGCLCLTKPFGPKELIEAVKHVLSAP